MAEEVIQSFYGRVGIGITDPSTDLEVGGFGNIKTTNLTVNGVTNAFAPVGLIIMWSGASVPTGWALCDGSNGAPNLQDRFILSYGATYSVNTTGGSHTKTISSAIMATHTHTFTTTQDGSHLHPISNQSAALHNHPGSTSANADHTHPTSAGSAGDHSHTATSANSGNHAHNGNTNYTGGHNHNISTNRIALYRGNHTTNRSDYTCGQPNIRQYYQYCRSSGNHGHPDVRWAGGGAHTHPFSIASGGLHIHPISCASSGLHAHGISLASGSLHNHGVTINQNGTHTHTFTTSNTGGGVVKDIKPSYYVLAFIIKT